MSFAGRNGSLLSKELRSHLIPAANITALSFLSTGVAALDRALPHSGLPKGKPGAFVGKRGLGATHLWSRCALEVLKQNRWVCWIESGTSKLSPWFFLKNSGETTSALDKFLLVSAPKDQKQLLWILQETFASGLFDLIGCHLDDGHIPVFQMAKLKKWNQYHKNSLIFVSETISSPTEQQLSFLFQFLNIGLFVRKFPHIHNPFFINRSDFYAHPLHSLKSELRHNNSGTLSLPKSTHSF